MPETQDPYSANQTPQDLQERAKMLARQWQAHTHEHGAAQVAAIIESIPDGVYVGDAAGITLANQSALQMLGFDSLEQLNKSVLELSDQIQVRSAATGLLVPLKDQVFGRALHGEVASSEVVVRHLKTGQDKTLRSVAAPIMVDGDIVGVVAVNSDITSYRESAETAHANEQRLKLALQAADAGTWELDFQTGECRWSPEFAALHGLPPASPASVEIWQNSAVPTDSKVIARLISHPAPSGVDVDVEYRVDRDGEIYWINVKGQSLPDEQGRPARLIGIAIDTTARKVAEEALRRLAELEHQRAETLAELDRFRDAFLADASHELRNPLATIKGYTQMVDRSLKKMREEFAEDGALEKSLSRQAHFVSQAMSQIDRMGALLNQLFDLVGVENQRMSLNKQPGLDIVQLVLRVVAEQRLSNLDRVIEVATTDEVIEGDWDEARLEQVLNNLIGNAIKYSPRDSVITVTVNCRSAGADGRLSDEALVAVRDEGGGIDPVDQEHIFERFYRAQNASTRNVKGLGVGLFISAEIVRLHNGNIWVDSAPGQGSTFYIALPIELHLQA